MTSIPLSRSGREATVVAAEAAKKAGEVLRTHFREERRVEYKGRANIVTDVDHRADSVLQAFLQSEFPDHSIISEESDPLEKPSEYTWILDPLDGTNNYSFGIPFFGTIVALTCGDEALLGVIYDPLRGELFAACRGGGTTLNGRPVSVSKKTAVRDSLIGVDLGYVEEKGKRLLEFMAGLWPGMYAYRIMGSAGLGMAYAACGRLDLYCHLLLYPWELACCELLVTEAGGVVTDWEGGPVIAGESSIIAANEAVHSDFLRVIGEAALK
jgi:myo-inositol-1(or 4)-monophosphatase